MFLLLIQASKILKSKLFMHPYPPLEHVVSAGPVSTRALPAERLHQDQGMGATEQDISH